MTVSDPIKRIQDLIRNDALAQGFGDIAFTSADANPDLAARLDQFLAEGRHASMDWMRETRDRRISPKAMWAEAKTAIVMVMNYGPDHDPMDNLADGAGGNISVYARGKDYHDVIKGKLKQIAGRIAAREKVGVKVFVDTAPLMEKPLAHQSGLGWQGKHTNLVSRSYGSWLFIGTILVDADWAEDSISEDHCGTCTRCLDICPTNAFPAPYQLDARRCISYLTIEHDGPIPVEFRAAMGNRIFGCDDCLAVCPWNSFAQEAREIKLMAKDGLNLPPLADLLNLDEDGFKQKFAGTPVRRAGYVNFMRNVIIAAGNAPKSPENNTLTSLLRGFLGHDAPAIKTSVIWALKQRLDMAEFAAISDEYAPNDSDPVVQAEWA